jgi:hypothetical protein
LENTSLLEHVFIRTEADGKYTLFLKIDPSLLEKDVDITLNNHQQLVMTFDDGLVLTTKTLSDDIYDSLANRQTLTVFTDEEGVFIANQVLDPLSKPKMRIK